MAGMADDVQTMTKVLRVAAYVICVRDDRILLARWVSRHGPPRWTLPGGGIDHGEDPADAALRELTEETGYAGRLDRLLGIHSLVTVFPKRPDEVAATDFHGLRVVYEGSIVGGELRDEVGGSTDRAAWIAFDEVEKLDRVSLVDEGIALWRQRPPDGHLG